MQETRDWPWVWVREAVTEWWARAGEKEAARVPSTMKAKSKAEATAKERERERDRERVTAASDSTRQAGADNDRGQCHGVCKEPPLLTRSGAGCSSS